MKNSHTAGFVYAINLSIALIGRIIVIHVMNGKIGEIQVDNGNGSFIKYWIRNMQPVETNFFIVLMAIILVLLIAIVSLTRTNSRLRRNSNSILPPEIVIVNKEPELHILNNLLEHLKEQHNHALRSSRRNICHQIRMQQLVVANDIEDFVREIVEIINVRANQRETQ